MDEETRKALKEAGLTYEQIKDIERTEKDGVFYDLDEAFEIIRNRLFSNKSKNSLIL